MRRLARLSVPVALAAILLAGCSAEPPGSGADPAPAATDGAAESGADRQVVHVGDLDLIAADVPGTAGRAIAAVTAVDGFVAGDRRSDRDGSATATLTLRIPAEAYTATVETLAALGEERSRQLSTTDVTEESVDLDTRIATKKASVDRVRELMVDADSLSEVVALEAELTTRETELAELQAEQRGLGDAIAYGTLTLKLSAPATVDESADGPAGFGGGLAAGWRGFLTAGAILLTVLGFLLPFLAVLVPVGAGIAWSRRRRGLPMWRPRRKKPVPRPPLAPPPGPGRF